MPQLTATQTKLLQKLNLDPSDPNLKAKIRNILDKQGQKPQPLPNLEFKFVCANSLVGIKEAEGLEDSEIPLLRDELKRIRQNTFKSGADKQKLQTEWKETTDKLFELQVDSGFYDQNSTNLALWNPYEKTPANFFDPQWMFGVEANTVSPQGGFDLVIGNPPYISALNMKKQIPEEVRKIYKNDFVVNKGSVDMYILFFEKGLRLLRKNGVLVFITPSKYLSARYGIELRKFILSYSLEQLFDYSKTKVFESADVSTLITLIKNSKQSQFVKTFFHSKKKVCSHINNKNLLTKLPENIWGILLSEDSNLINKIIDNSVSAKDFLDINASSTAGEAEEYLNYITENKINPKLINTGTIRKYNSLWGIKKIKAKHINILTPYLDISKISERRANMYKAPKLIFSKLTKNIVATFDKYGEYASVNTNFILNPKDGYNLNFLAGYFNSSLFDYVFKKLFGGLSMYSSIQVQAPQLRISPIPILDTPQKQQTAKQIEELVEEILLIKNGENTPSLRATPHEGNLGSKQSHEENLENGDTVITSTEELEKRIDELVFGLYGLGEEEIGVVVG